MSRKRKQKIKKKKTKERIVRKDELSLKKEFQVRIKKKKKKSTNNVTDITYRFIYIHTRIASIFPFLFNSKRIRRKILLLSSPNSPRNKKRRKKHIGSWELKREEGCARNGEEGSGGGSDGRRIRQKTSTQAETCGRKEISGRSLSLSRSPYPSLPLSSVLMHTQHTRRSSSQNKAECQVIRTRDTTQR